MSQSEAAMNRQVHTESIATKSIATKSIAFSEAERIFSCTLTPSGLILAANSPDAAGLNYAIDRLLQTPVWQLFHVDDRPQLQAALATLTQPSAPPIEQRCRLCSAEGHIFPVRVMAQGLQGTESIILLTCDAPIGPQEREQDEIRQRYHCIVETCSKGIWEIDENSNTCFVSAHMAEMLGYSPAEMLGQPLFAFMDEKGQAIAARKVEQRQQGESEQHDFKFRHRDGSDVWVIISTSPMMNRSGQYAGALAMMMDISDRKRMELALVESEQRLQAILNAAPLSISIKDAQGRYTRVNPAFEVMMNRTQEQLLGLTDDDLLPIDQAAACRISDQLVLTEGKTLIFEESVFIEGQTRSLLITKFPLLNAAGYPDTICSIVLEITDSKRAEVKLQVSESKLNAILDNAIAAICCSRIYANYEWEYEYFSSGAQAVYGYSADELLADKRLWSASVAAEDWDAIVLPSFEDVFAERPNVLEYRFQRKDGTLSWIRETSTSRRDDALDCWIVTTVAINITGRKQAEEALRQSEEKFRAIFEHAAIGIGLNGFNGDLLETNPAWQAMIGYSAAELRQMHFRDYTHPEDVDKDEAHYAALISGQRNSYQMEKRYVCKDGRVFWGRLTASIVRGTQGEPQFAFGMVEDITERKQAEDSLRQSEERWQLAIEGSNDGIWDWNILTRHNFSSARCKTMLGYEEHEWEATYEAWIDLIHPDDLEEYRRIIQAHLDHQTPYCILEYRLRCKDGSYKWVLSRGQTVWDDQGKPTRMVGSQADISDRKRIEIELKAASDRLEHLLKATPAVIFSCKPIPNYGNTFMSENVRAVLGYESQQFTADENFWKERVHPDDLPHIFATVPQLSDVQAHGYEYRFLHADGTYRWLYAQINLIKDECGHPLEIVGYLIDIDDRKRSEEALRQSEERWHLAIQATGDGIWDWDVKTNRFFYSKRWKEMLGYGEDELENSMETWSDRIHPEDVDFVMQALQPYLDQLQPDYKIEYRLRCKDGSYRWILTQGRARWDEEGNISRVVGSHSDITEQRQSEAALRDSEAHFRTIFADAPIGMALVTAEEQIVLANAVLCRMLGQGEACLKTQSVSDIVYPEDIDECRRMTRKLFSFEVSQYSLERRFLRFDGEVIWLRITAVLFQEINGGALYKLAMFENVTERRALDQMKNNFISVVSHELRTPLSSVQGSLGLLATGQIGDLTPEGGEVLAIAVSESKRLERLINDILDLERVKSGHISIKKECCQVAEIISRAIESMSSRAEAAGIELESSPISQTIWADGDRILQSLTNLIDNAIKFSPPGSKVWVSAELIGHSWIDAEKDASSGSPTILFTVRDRGRGIPAEKMEVIFEPFEQTEAADFRQKGGSGLGLAICRSIIQEHGGQIWTTSTLGQGSTFFFTLPQDSHLEKCPESGF